MRSQFGVANLETQTSLIGEKRTANVFAGSAARDCSSWAFFNSTRYEQTLTQHPLAGFFDKVESVTRVRGIFILRANYLRLACELCAASHQEDVDHGILHQRS